METKGKICPYCGNKKIHRTTDGWVEASLKGTASIVLGVGIAFFDKHHAAHLMKEMSEKNSSEYMCDKCGKKFRYSDKKGSFK